MAVDSIACTLKRGLEFNTAKLGDSIQWHVFYNSPGKSSFDLSVTYTSQSLIYKTTKSRLSDVPFGIICRYQAGETGKEK